MSNTFRDGEGRSWTISLSFAELAKLSHRTGQGPRALDLLGVVRSPGSVRAFLAGDPEDLAVLLCWLLAEELDWRGISPEMFRAALDADAIQAGSRAVLFALSDLMAREGKRAEARGNLTAWLTEEEGVHHGR